VYFFKLRKFQTKIQLFFTLTLFSLGRVEYQAPELLVGGQATRSADWYSLGITLYFMMYSTLPFDGIPLVATHSRRIMFPFKEECSDELRDLIWRLTELNPSKRLRGSKVKRHEYFSDIDWSKVFQKEYDLSRFLPVKDNNRPYLQQVANVS
jgi:serine/threonine protein kinase